MTQIEYDNLMRLLEVIGAYGMMCTFFIGVSIGAVALCYEVIKTYKKDNSTT